MNKPLQNKILANIIKHDSNGCWLWRGQISNSGYGKLMIKNESNQIKMEGAQEVSYKAFIEPIPKNSFVRHTCPNRLCVNPEHLEIFTPKQD